jgi:hypothetical protein
MSALSSPCVVLSTACFNSEPLTRSDDRKRLAEAARLALNDGYRAFQHDGGACGCGAGVNQHHQLAYMSCGPLSAANANHVTQSVVSGLVPKYIGERAVRR